MRNSMTAFWTLAAFGFAAAGLPLLVGCAAPGAVALDADPGVARQVRLVADSGPAEPAEDGPREVTTINRAQWSNAAQEAADAEALAAEVEGMNADAAARGGSAAKPPAAAAVLRLIDVAAIDGADFGLVSNEAEPDPLPMRQPGAGAGIAAAPDAPLVAALAATLADATETAALAESIRLQGERIGIHPQADVDLRVAALLGAGVRARAAGDDELRRELAAGWLIYYLSSELPAAGDEYREWESVLTTRCFPLEAAYGRAVCARFWIVAVPADENGEWGPSRAGRLVKEAAAVLLGAELPAPSAVNESRYGIVQAANLAAIDAPEGAADEAADRARFLRDAIGFGE